MSLHSVVPEPAEEAAPVEGKVTAQWIGHALGLALAGFAAWALGVLVWGAPADAEHATQAAASVPAPVLGLVALIPLGVGFAFGYAAKHSPRPAELPAQAIAAQQALLSTLQDQIARLMELAEGATAGQHAATPGSWTQLGGTTDGFPVSPTGPADQGWTADVLGAVPVEQTSTFATVGEQGPTMATLDPSRPGGLQWAQGGPVSAAQSMGQES